MNGESIFQCSYANAQIDFNLEPVFSGGTCYCASGETGLQLLRQLNSSLSGELSAKPDEKKIYDCSKYWNGSHVSSERRILRYVAIYVLIMKI